MRPFFQPFFGLLTILSFTLTQVLPAWALRPSGADSAPTRSGLEEALTAEGLEPAEAFPGISVEEVTAILRALEPLQERPVAERAQALRDSTGPLPPAGNAHTLPSRANDVMRRLVLAVADGVLSLDEASDPMLAFALLAPGDRRLQERAAKTVSSWERLCPQCLEHALHETKPEAEMTPAEHGALHVLAGVATAMDLILLNGDLRSLDGISGVDHGKEIARTAQTAAWLHEVMGKKAVTPGRASLDESTLRHLSRLEDPVVALVSHTRTPSWKADHYVRIVRVNAASGTVVYEDNGERKAVTIADFIALHRPSDGKAVFFLDAGQAARVRDAGVRVKPLSRREMTGVAGGCGIILHVGRYSQEGGLASAFDAAYRGKDDTGEIVVEPTGLRRVTVQGSPSALVRSFQLLGQGYPEEAMVWYLEANPQEQIPDELREALNRHVAGRVLTERQRYLIHRKWRSLSQQEAKRIEDHVAKKSADILRDQGLDWVKPVRLDVTDPGTRRRRPAVKDDLYRITFYDAGDPAVQANKKVGDVRLDNSVGRGKRGAVWSGRTFKPRSLPPEAPWDACRKGLTLLVDHLRGLYRYDVTSIREILRWELVDRMGRMSADGSLETQEAARMEAAFVRYFEQVWMGQEMKASEQAEWRAAWAILASGPVLISGHVSPDPIRHAFRLQASLAASIRRNPTAESALQDLFSRSMPPGRKARHWYDDWRVECNTNTPGAAFTALTEWFQRNLPPESRSLIEFGQMDALTLAYLHTVDRKLRHDRWATTGSRIAKDAQPVTDTGLLSNVNSDELGKIMTIVRRRYNREVAKVPTSTKEEKTEILRSQFLFVLQDYVRQHPELEGTPARGFAHNGDLDPDVQTGILGLLQRSGYVNEQIRVDAETGDVKREQILTDTWKLGALVEFVFDAYRKDRKWGLISDDGSYSFYTDTTGVGFMPPAYRVLWNTIATNLRSSRMQASAEEISQRIALREFARGVLVKPGSASSEIALGWITLYEPELDGVVSHRRAVELVVARDGNNVQVQYTSDALTALRMFEPQAVENAIRQDTAVSADFQRSIYELVQRRGLPASDPQHLTAEQYEQEQRLLVARNKEAEKSAGGGFKAELSITLKGEQKYVKVRKVWVEGDRPDSGRFEVEIDITNFEGQPLATIRPGKKDEIVEAEQGNIKVHRNRTITIAAASKGGFPTFGLKEILSEVGALAQMHVYAGVRKGVPGSLDITKEGLQRTAEELRQLAQQGAGEEKAAGLEEAEGGLNRAALERFLENAIRTGSGTNVRTGVGSSENDSSAARAINRYLLPMIGYDNITPSRLISTARHYDPEATLAGGISWSGTTALTLLALQWLKSQGVSVEGLTGNPTVKDLTDVVEDSAGTVHARTKKEVAIYTTVGYLMLLEGLFEETIQQNLIAQELAEKAGNISLRDDLKRRLEEIYGDYSSMVEHLATVLSDPARDYRDENSSLNIAGRHFRKCLGMQFIGDYYNNPIVDEIGIKVGETRNINFTSYDYRSHGYESVARAEGSNVGWSLNATSMNRIREATGVLRKAREIGVSVMVQTFDPQTVRFTEEERAAGYEKDWQEFQQELQKLEQEFTGAEDGPLAIRFQVPQVHFTLQPMLDVITGQLFGVAVAQAAGYSNEATDGPRNLAKSVTVLGVQLAFGSLTTVARFLSLDRQVSDSLQTEMDFYRGRLAKRWEGLASAVDQSLQRLPLRVGELMQHLRMQGGFELNETSLEDSFGSTLDGLRRIVVLFDTDEAAEVAGRMASIPLSNSEVVLSDSQDDKLFAKAKDERGHFKPNAIRRAINGREATIHFHRSQADRREENRISIQFDGEPSPAIEFSGDERGILQAVQAQPGTHYDPENGTVILAERTYKIQVLDNKRGISLSATQPDLLGVAVEIHRPTDFTLDQDIGNEGTLVVAISRSNHRGTAEAQLVPTASVEGRDKAQGAQVAGKGLPEGSLKETLERLRERGAPIFVIADENSEILDSATHGRSIVPGQDLDASSSVTAYYASLLLLGARLGTLCNVPEAALYERALGAAGNILSRTLDSLYTEEAETGARLFRPDVASVTVNVGHVPLTCSFTADTPQTGTIRMARKTQDAEQTVLELKVTVNQATRQVTGIADPQPYYEMDGRSYRITLDPERGIVIRGVEPDYEGGGSLRDALVSLRQNRFGPEENTGRPYRSWGVIGGVQDRAGAAAVAAALEQNGYQAKHLEVDESVHGWYALINDAIEKNADYFWREGVSPDFDPDNRTDGQLDGKDVGIIILATDSRTFGASIVDAQRARTRNARFILVVKESDRNNPSVVNSGAFAIVTVPDTFNEMLSFSHEMVGRVLAQEIRRSEGRDYAYSPGSPWAELARLPHAETREIGAAETRISLVAQDQVETELEGRGRTLEQVERFIGLFAAQRANGQPLEIARSVEQLRGEAYHCVYAVFPYNPVHRMANPQEGIRANLRTFSRNQRRKDLDIHDLFLAGITEAEGAQEMIYVRMELNSAEDADFVESQLVAAAAPYNAAAIAPPAAAPLEVATQEFLERLKRGTGVFELPPADQEQLEARVMGAFSAHRATELPKALVIPHPSAPDERCILVAVDQNRTGLLALITNVISEEVWPGHPTGDQPNFGDTVSQSVGGITYVALEITNRPASQMADRLAKVEDTLYGKRVKPSDDFLEVLKPHEQQMPGAPREAVYAAFMRIQRGEPAVVRTSSNAPDRYAQSAIFVMVPVQGTERMDHEIRRVIEENGLSVVAEQGRELTFHETYQGDPAHRPVRMLRYVVNLPYGHPNVKAALNALRGLAGARRPIELTAATVESRLREWLTADFPNLPNLGPLSIDALHASILPMHSRYRETGEPQMAVFSDATDPTRVFLAIVAPEHPRLDVVITQPLANRGWSRSGGEIMETAPDGSVFFLADVAAPPEQLQRVVDGAISYGLRGLMQPLDFRAAIGAENLARMGEGSDYYLFGLYDEVRESGQPTVVISSNTRDAEGSPAAERLSALVIAAPRNWAAQADLESRISAALRDAGLTLDSEIRFEYPGEPKGQEQPVAFLRFTVEARWGDTRLQGLLDIVEDLIRDVAAAPAPTAPPAVPPVPPAAPLLGGAHAEIDGQVTPEIAQAAEERGWTLDTTLNVFRTPQSGLVSPSAVRGVDPQATVENGAWVRGSQTRIDAGARVTGRLALVQDAELWENAVVEDSVVMTDPSKAEGWSWNKQYEMPAVERTVIGRGTQISPFLGGGGMEPAMVMNATLGDDSRVEGGSLTNSRIGERNVLRRAKVALTASEDNVRIATEEGLPTEVSECYLGWGHSITSPIYGEYLAPNFIRRAWVTDGTVVFETVSDLPACVFLAERVISASYDGTGKLGREYASSRHGKGVLFPGSIAGQLTNLIMLVHPDFENPEDLLRQESMDVQNSPFAQLTVLHPLSFSYRAAGTYRPESVTEDRPNGEIWGHVLPGSSRYGLNQGDFEPGWVFTHARRAVEQVLEEMHRQVDAHADTVGWDTDRRDTAHRHVDNLPRYAIETAEAMARMARSSGVQGADVLEAKFHEFLANGGPRVKTTRTETGYQVSLSLHVDEADRFSLEDLLASQNRDLQAVWRDKPLFPAGDWEQLHALGDGVEISTDAKIGQSATVLGTRARLGPGVVVPDGATVTVSGAILENVTLADGAVCINTVMREGTLGREVRLTNVQAGKSDFKPRSTATGVVTDTADIGEKATLEPYARVTSSTIPAGGIIGIPVENSDLEARGFTAHHLTGYANHLEAPQLDTAERPVSPHNNLSAGVWVKGSIDKPVVWEGAMTGANTPMEAGSKIGFLGFAKGALGGDQVVPAFALSTGTEPRNLRRGFVARSMPSMVMRFLGKGIAGSRAALASLISTQLTEAGLPDLQERWNLTPVEGTNGFENVGGRWVFQPRYSETEYGPDQGYGPNPLYNWNPDSPTTADLGTTEAPPGGTPSPQTRLIPAPNGSGLPSQVVVDQELMDRQVDLPPAVAEWLAMQVGRNVLAQTHWLGHLYEIHLQVSRAPVTVRINSPQTGAPEGSAVVAYAIPYQDEKTLARIAEALDQAMEDLSQKHGEKILAQGNFSVAFQGEETPVLFVLLAFDAALLDDAALNLQNELLFAMNKYSLNRLYDDSVTGEWRIPLTQHLRDQGLGDVEVGGLVQLYQLASSGRGNTCMVDPINPADQRWDLAVLPLTEEQHRQYDAEFGRWTQSLDTMGVQVRGSHISRFRQSPESPEVTLALVAFDRADHDRYGLNRKFDEIAQMASQPQSVRGIALPPQEAGLEEQPAAGRPGLTPEEVSILIVDDDEMTRMFVGAGVTRAVESSPDPLARRISVESQMREAASREEALAQIRANPPTLLFTDLNAPEDGAGFEIAQAARAANPDAVIILVAAPHADQMDRVQEFLTNGIFDEFFPKPVKPQEEIIPAVQTHIIARLSESGAGLEEAIPLPAGATERKVVFLTPEILTSAFLDGLARLSPAEGEQIPVVVFAQNAFQLAQVEERLTDNVRVLEKVNVQDAYGGVLSEAVADKQMVYFVQGLGVQVVYTLSDLEALGKFLQMPDISLRSWKESITQEHLGVQA